MATQEPGYHIKGQCGREWFVPIAAVGRDYAEFLMQADKLSETEAVAQSNAVPDFWQTWFSDQCCYWEDIERLGRLVQPVGRFKTRKANDRARGHLQFAKIEYQTGEV